MKNPQRYSDKFLQKPLLRNASEERKNLITNREKYILYLENQIELVNNLPIFQFTDFKKVPFHPEPG